MPQRSAWLDRLREVPRQLRGANPFEGDCLPTRVPLFAPGSGRPTAPFPHPWNYDRPIDLLATYFWGADEEEGPGRHNRYLDCPGFDSILVTRDPGVIRAITTKTGERGDQFDRDPLPSTGIARATGSDTLLYANGSVWKRQRKMAAAPFGKTALFQPERFGEFAATFRETVRGRLAALDTRLAERCESTCTLELEPEIKAVMLEMLTVNFFGACLDYEAIRWRYVPALERVIDHIVRDTVTNWLGVPIRQWPGVTRHVRQVKAEYAAFEELTDAVLATRREGAGLWSSFKSDAPNHKLRSNLKVFLAGALEATTSYAGWAVSHLARRPDAQEKVYEEIRDVEDYTPECLAAAPYFTAVLEETLRLTPSLYFLPRQAGEAIWIETSDGRRLRVPRGAHVLLDVWHANRHEDH